MLKPSEKQCLVKLWPTMPVEEKERLKQLSREHQKKNYPNGCEPIMAFIHCEKCGEWIREYELDSKLDTEYTCYGHGLTDIFKRCNICGLRLSCNDPKIEVEFHNGHTTDTCLHCAGNLLISATERSMHFMYSSLSYKDLDVILQDKTVKITYS